MDLFSYRQGIKKKPDTYQTESISPELRNRLWSCLYAYLFKNAFYFNRSVYPETWEHPEHRKFCYAMWDGYLKLPVDTFPSNGDLANDQIRRFFFSASWDEQYSFIEYCVRNSKDTKTLISCINGMLEQEFAGFRLVGDCITPIIDSKEIGEIEKALTIDKEVKEHLQTALKYLSDKQNPDYRNSIKESISAVEAICKKIVNNPNATLGDALNTIEKHGQIEFHGALKAGIRV